MPGSTNRPCSLNTAAMNAKDPMSGLLSAMRNIYGVPGLGSISGPCKHLESQIKNMCEQLLDMGRGPDLQGIAQEYLELITDLAPQTADISRKGSRICDEACNVQWCLKTVGDFAIASAQHAPQDDPLHELYNETSRARDALLKRWLEIARTLTEILRSCKDLKDVGPKLDSCTEQLDHMKAFLLIIWIGLTQPDQLLAEFDDDDDFYQRDPIGITQSAKFQKAHYAVLKQLSDECGELKDSARSMLIDATHVEKKMGLDVPSQLMDALYDQLLFMFMDTKDQIDQLAKALATHSGEMSRVKIRDHLDMDTQFQGIRADIQTFKNKIEDSSIYRDAAANVVQKGHVSLGAYLVTEYNKTICPSGCKCGRAAHGKLGPESSNSVAHALDAQLGTLPDLSEIEMALITRIYNRYKISLKTCRKSIKEIDKMLYGSNLNSYEREKLRYSTVTFRLVPTLIHTSQGYKTLRNPAVRHQCARQVTEEMVEEQEDWLSEMDRQAGWAKEKVIEVTETAGPLVLSKDQKLKVLAGVSELQCAGTCGKQMGIDIGDAGGDEDEDEQDHVGGKRKQTKVKAKKKKAGRKHK